VVKAAHAPLLRTSERGDFKHCPWLWNQVWNLGWRSKREPTWAWFGSAIHKGLEARYPVGRKRGTREAMLEAFEVAIDKEVRRVYTEGGELDETEVVDGKELGRQMLLGYVKEFGDDSAWEVLDTEGTFQIDVPHPTKDKTLVVYCGTWDLVIYDLVEKVYKVVDHKTRKAFPGNWEFYTINDQAGSYLWVAPEVLLAKGIFKGGEAIEGLVFNALRKHLPDTRPRDADGNARNKPIKAHYHAALDAAKVPYSSRDTIPVLHALATQHGLPEVLGDISAKQPAELFHREEVYRTPQERVTQARRVQQEAVWMSLIRKGKLEPIKHTSEDCVRCPLFDVCQTHEQDPEAAWELRAATMVKRDPYRDHREAMEENGFEVKLNG
jgi:hypothetical protein